MKKINLLVLAVLCLSAMNVPASGKGGVNDITVMSLNIRCTSAQDGPNSWDFRAPAWAIFKDKKSGSKLLCVDTHLDNPGENARHNGIALIMSKIAECQRDCY